MKSISKAARQAAYDFGRDCYSEHMDYVSRDVAAYHLFGASDELLDEVARGYYDAMREVQGEEYE
jgi:hypothetical protein